MAMIAIAIAVLVALTGCIGISSTATSQPASMGPLTLTVGACATGSPGCSATSNTAALYTVLDELGTGESFPGQALLAVRLPEGSVPPDTINATISGGGTLQFNRNAGYESQLQALEPAPAGERWWGWISGQFSYSTSSKQGFTATFTATLPRPADGGPYPSPLHWRPVVGAREVSAERPASRPVNCGPEPSDLYEGFSEYGGVNASIVCVDSPDESATRGFLEAPLIDFGIVGTAVTASPGGTLTATFLAKRSGGNDFATTFALAAATGIPGGTVSIDRDSVPLGGDSVVPVQATISVPAGTAPGSYPVTLTATAPGKPERSGTVTVTVPADPPRAPTLKASLNRKRFRPGAGKLRITLSTRATVSIAIARLSGKKAKKLGTMRRSLPAGKSVIKVGSKLGKVRLKPGRHRLTLRAARDGLSSPKRTLTFKLLRN